MILVFFALSFGVAVVAASWIAAMRVGASVVLCMPCCVVVLLAADCVVAGLLAALVGSAPEAATLACIHLAYFLIAAAVGWKKGLRGRGTLVSVGAADLIALLGLAAEVAAFAVVQFGVGLNLNFASTDPGTHFSAALSITETGQVPGLYFTHYTTAVLIEAASFLVPAGASYKIFIVAEVLYLFLNAAVFYSLLRLAVHGGFAVSLVAALLYTAGYPLTNMVFGFSYLGMGVTLLMAFSLVLVMRNKLGRCLSIGLFALFLVGEWVCYNLFVPIMMLILCLVALAHIAGARKWSRAAYAGALVLFSLLCLVAIAAVIESGYVSGLATPGYSYNELYGSFALLAPAAILGLVQGFRGKSLDAVGAMQWVSIAVVVSTAVGLALYWAGVLSAYYYARFYYLLWVVLFVCAVQGLCSLMKQNAAFALCYGGVYLVIVSMAFLGIDQKITTSHPDLSPSAASSSLAGVYAFNSSEMRTSTIPDDEVDLWNVADSLREQDEEYVPLLGTNIDVYWYQAQTRQYCSQGTRYYYFWQYDSDDWGQELVSRLEEANYCIVLDDLELPENVETYLHAKQVVYSNEVGYIVAI